MQDARAKALAQTLSSLHPDLVHAIRDFLPKGSECFAAEHTDHAFKWDYAIVLYHDIQTLDELFEKSSGKGAVKNYYTAMIENYKYLCCDSELFANISPYLPEHTGTFFLTPLKKEVISGMKDAIMEDIVLFSANEDFPVYYQNLETWKHFQAYNMLQVMGMHRAEYFETVKFLFKQWRNGVQHLKHNPMYQSTANFMTLLERIQLLENRVINLEAETK